MLIPSGRSGGERDQTLFFGVTTGPVPHTRLTNLYSI